MSGSGKSLQDIYDAGTKKLEELEQAQHIKLEGSGAQGVEELGRIETGALQKMDSSLGELEKEIRAQLEKAVDGISCAVDSEIEENRKFLERLLEALKLSCQSLSEDVKQLKESITQKFVTSADLCMTMQQREFEKGMGRLKTEGARSATQLKEISQSGLVSFSSKTASSVLQSMDKNMKLPTEFFAEFSKHAASIEKRINDCLMLLTQRQQEVIAVLKTNGSQVQSGLDQSVKLLAVEMETVYKNSDAELRRHCEEALSTALRYQEEISSKLATELQESHNSSGSAVSEKWVALTGGTASLLESVKQLLADVDAGIRQNSGELLRNFEVKLRERLERAQKHNQVVAEERSQLMVTIAGDLQKIENEFAARLRELSDNCQNRLSSVCVDAELAIIASHDKFAAEFKSLSSQQQTTVEQRTLLLFSEIERQSNLALQTIQMAAGKQGAQAPGAATASAAPASAMPAQAAASAMPAQAAAPVLPVQAPTSALPVQAPTPALPAQASQAVPDPLVDLNQTPFPSTQPLAAADPLAALNQTPFPSPASMQPLAAADPLAALNQTPFPSPASMQPLAAADPLAALNQTPFPSPASTQPLAAADPLAALNQTPFPSPASTQPLAAADPLAALNNPLASLNQTTAQPSAAPSPFQAQAAVGSVADSSAALDPLAAISQALTSALSAPAQAAPAQAAPAQAAPAQAAPAQAAPAQAAPAQAAPAPEEKKDKADPPQEPSFSSNPFGDFGDFKL